MIADNTHDIFDGPLNIFNLELPDAHQGFDDFL